MARQLRYINKTFTYNGDGSTPYPAASDGAAGAHNAVGTGAYAGTLDPTHFWKDDCSYLFVEGETWGSEVLVYQCKNIDIGSYDYITGLKTKDKNKRAIIDPGFGSHKASINLATTAATTKSNILIENLDLRGDRDSAGSTAASGVRSYTADYTEFSGIKIIGCRLDGYKGASICGTGIVCFDNDVAGLRGCFELFSTSYKILYNRLIDDAIYETGTDTILSDLTSSYSLNGVYIIGNDMVRMNYHTPKQAVYLTASSGTASLAAASGPIVITDNRFGGVMQCMIIHTDGAFIARNELLNILNPVDPDRVLDVSGAAFFTIKHGGVLRSNVCYGSPTATAVGFGSVGGTGSLTMENNLFHRVYAGVSDPYSGGASRPIVMRNNVFTLSSIAPTASYPRVFLKTLANPLTAQYNQYDPDQVPDPAGDLFLNLYVSQTTAEYGAAVEPSARFDAPQMDDDFRLLANAPTIHAGQGAGYILDKDGRLFNKPRSLGPYEFRSRPS